MRTWWRGLFEEGVREIDMVVCQRHGTISGLGVCLHPGPGATPKNPSTALRAAPSPRNLGEDFRLLDLLRPPVVVVAGALAVRGGGVASRLDHLLAVVAAAFLLGHVLGDLVVPGFVAARKRMAFAFHL